MRDEEIRAIRQSLITMRDSADQPVARGTLINAARELPKDPEFHDVFKLGFELIKRIENPEDRKMAILDFAKEIPSFGIYLSLYTAAVEESIDAADALSEPTRRISELTRLAGEMPKGKEFQGQRLRAWRLALGLPDKPRFYTPPIEKIAKELPQAADVAFYRGYTLMGIAKLMPKEGLFFDTYREAMQLAIKAACSLTEPYFRKYALIQISHELKDNKKVEDLYKESMTEAYKASIDTSDPFARQYGLIDMLQEIPKTEEFFPILQEILEQSLAFFTVRKWMEDVEVFDVVDFILSAEDTGINESKQKRFSRGKYADIIARELDEFGGTLNDTRFLETLKPYTHVWVQPKGLRDAVKKVVDHLESLKEKYHGKEIERPVFVSEWNPEGVGRYIHKKDPVTNECISIDLGATNTVIMRKKGEGAPDFVPLSPITKKYDNILLIPTILSNETNNIGAEITEDNPVNNIKQLLLEGNPKGKEYMERFFRILYQHLKKVTSTGGWLSFGQKSSADVLYITVPVGYIDYKNAMREIAERTVKGVKIEFIEEPLAAAVGYQVAEPRDKVMMVIDFGGSTLNTMVLRLNINEVHVVAKPERAQMLGGHDIDMWLAEHLAKKAGTVGGVPYRLLSVAEEIKIELSRRDEVPFMWDNREVGRITREELEEVLDSHDFYKSIDRTLSYVIKRAEKVGLKKDSIEAVLLTGGSSQIPSFKEKIGHVFPNLRRQNLIYDHSPLTAVGLGAALYGTRDITDRHLGMAYAVRYATNDKDSAYSHTIILEKGDTLPIEKTFRIKPAKKLGAQKEVYLELFEVPESILMRKWVMESGIEFIKQEIRPGHGMTLNGLKTVTLDYKEPIDEEALITLCIGESGLLSVKYGPENTLFETDLRLQ